jgi:hypothetical protein
MNKYYYNIIIVFFNVVCNNAFLLTQVNKIYFANTKHINRKSKLLLNNNNNNNNNINNNSYDEFPCFYEFLRTHSIQNIKENEEDEENEENEENEEDEDNGKDISETVESIKADFLNFKANFNETIKTSNSGKDFANTINSKHLKLLTAFSAIQWARTWIYEMVHINAMFPIFMYQDMYKMCDYGSVNVSKRYFYIGYYPPRLDQRKGPYYIGAFEVNPLEREFITRIIIQNPYFSIKNDYAKEYIMNFKKELEALCVEATVFFKYASLKNTSFERYYYSWHYEE